MKRALIKRAPSRQKGYFIIVAIILILLLGVMGSTIGSLMYSRSFITLSEYFGLKAFYIAESGLEVGLRLLTTPTLSGTTGRLSCNAGITGTSAITNSAMANGQFTLTGTSGNYNYATTTLSTAMTAASTTIPLTSTTGFASNGRVVIEGEIINYEGISGSNLINLTRGVYGGVAAMIHAVGAKVGQYQCTIQSQSGIPNLTSPRYMRTLTWNVQLQDAYGVADNSGAVYVHNRFNYPTEKTWVNNNDSRYTSAVDHNSVSMLSYDDGWEVGANIVNGATSFFLIGQYSGGIWNYAGGGLAANCYSQSLLAISMVSSTDGYAVGTAYPYNCGVLVPNRFTILRYSSGTWAILSSPTIPADQYANGNLNGVSIISTNNSNIGNFGFAVSSTGQIIYYNGTTWALMISPTTTSLNDIKTVSGSEAWAVGNNGLILKYTGSANTWTIATSPASSNALNSIAMIDLYRTGNATGGFAVGNNGLIEYYNGSSWSLMTSNTTANLYGVIAYTANDAYAGGAGGVMMHWNGSTWSSIASGITTDINAMSKVNFAAFPASNWQQVFG